MNGATYMTEDTDTKQNPSFPEHAEPAANAALACVAGKWATERH